MYFFIGFINRIGGLFMKAFKLFPLGAYPFLKPEKLFVKQCRIDTKGSSPFTKE